MQAPLHRLIAGLDTIQAAYYLRPHSQGAFEFEPLMVAKERLRADKSRKGELLRIGGESFLLQGHGSKSGYSLVLDHVDFTVECGEFNNPPVLPHVILLPDASRTMLPGALTLGEFAGILSILSQAQSDAEGGR